MVRKPAIDPDYFKNRKATRLWKPQTAVRRPSQVLTSTVGNKTSPLRRIAEEEPSRWHIGSPLKPHSH